MTKKLLGICLMIGISLLVFKNYFLLAEQKNMKLMSSAFNNGDYLPKDYTCEGKNVNPPLEWNDAPEGAKSFVLIVDDPDAPATKPLSWIHWILFNIPATINKLDENLSIGKLMGAKQGHTSDGKNKFHGACPPQGDGIHHYHFRLYALNTLLDLQEGATKEELFDAMKNNIIAEAELSAIYERK